MTVAPSNMGLFTRSLDIREILTHVSAFLLGSRMMGKLAHIRETLPDALTLDRLRFDDFSYLRANPSHIEEALERSPDTELIVIDEVRKAPHLLDEVHRLIKTRGVRFLLTGSSARNLRWGGVNLLDGRAKTIYFLPFLMREL